MNFHVALLATQRAIIICWCRKFAILPRVNILFHITEPRNYFFAPARSALALLIFLLWCNTKIVGILRTASVLSYLHLMLPHVVSSISKRYLHLLVSSMFNKRWWSTEGIHNSLNNSVVYSHAWRSSDSKHKHSRERESLKLHLKHEEWRRETEKGNWIP